MSWSDLPFCGESVERAAHRRTDPRWLAEAWQRARVLVVSAAGAVPVTGAQSGEPRLAFVSAADAPPGERLFLGVHDDVPYFAVVGELPSVPATTAETLPRVGAQLDDVQAALLVTAVGVANWRAAYRFSPATGAPLVARAGGWEAVAEDGSGTVWPRTNPAVIVLISDGVAGAEGSCLLAHHVSAPVGRYTCVAGFVEPGESAEAAVRREAHEETGVRVRDVRYRSSQPWPLPASLMLGFTATADPGQPVTVDGIEVADARWFTRGELLAGLDEPASPLSPSWVSISRALIEDWLREQSDAY